MKRCMKRSIALVALGMIITTAQGVWSQETFCIDFRPNTLNIDSCGVLTTVYIEPVGYTPVEIDASTILLNGVVAPLFEPTCFSADVTCESGVNERMVKFNRDEVAAILPLGAEVIITITGMLADGTSFEGTDVVRVIERAECLGDFDYDNDVDGTDAGRFRWDFGRNPFNKACEGSDPCYGNFDCDSDCDGSDASTFKTDFGRNGLINPCPPLI